MVKNLSFKTVRLILEVVAFTLLVPGTVVAVIPYLLLSRPPLGSIDVLGASLLGALPIVLGVAIYGRCARDFVLSGRALRRPSSRRWIS